MLPACRAGICFHQLSLSYPWSSGFIHPSLAESLCVQKEEQVLQLVPPCSSPGEFCTLSSALTRNKMETRLFKGSRRVGCLRKPCSSVNVNGTMTVMQAHTKPFYLIEAEGTEKEKRNQSGRHGNGSSRAPAHLLCLLQHKVL